MTGIVAGIRGRLPEQPESGVIRTKKYPKEVNQSSVKKGDGKTIPVTKSSWDDHRLVASLVKPVSSPV